jgi:hypothetical protein
VARRLSRRQRILARLQTVDRDDSEKEARQIAGKSVADLRQPQISCLRVKKKAVAHRPQIPFPEQIHSGALFI